MYKQSFRNIETYKKPDNIRGADRKPANKIGT